MPGPISSFALYLLKPFIISQLIHWNDSSWLIHWIFMVNFQFFFSPQAKYIAEAEQKYESLLKTLDPQLSLNYQKRCEEATKEGNLLL
jgi:hypothetical protein